MTSTEIVFVDPTGQRRVIAVLARNRSAHNSVDRSCTRPPFFFTLHITFTRLIEAVWSGPRSRGLETQRSTGGSPGHITPSQEIARWQRRKRPRRRPRRRSSFLASMRGSWLRAGSPLCLSARKKIRPHSSRMRATRRRRGALGGHHLRRRSRLGLWHRSPHVCREPRCFFHPAAARDHDSHRFLIVACLNAMFHADS